MKTTTRSIFSNCLSRGQTTKQCIHRGRLAACILSAIAATLAVGEAVADDIQLTSLRCEYRQDPIGIDVVQPRLSWTLEGAPTKRGLTQSAYHVLVASTPEKLAADKGDLWDSGKVESHQQLHVAYAGKPLASRTACHWKVRVWHARHSSSSDGGDPIEQPSGWSKPAVWSMGLLEAGEWQGKWIAATDHLAAPREAGLAGDHAHEAGKEVANQPGNAAVLLRKEIQLDGKVTRATAFLCGLGYSELEVNGRKIGTDVLDPGFTDFSRRVLYRTYDVTEAIRQGPNALGVILGGGWFNLATGDLFGFQSAPWSASPRLLCQLHIEFADGTSRTVVSDASWKWSTGAITFNCVRGGETIDAREDKPGWSLAGYDDSTWSAAVVVDRPAGKLVSQQHPAIRATAAIRPVALTEPKPGVHVFDLGVNISGWARLTTRGPRGTRIQLQSNELLNQDGTLNTEHCTSHTHGRFQTEEYIRKGEGVETFEPRFTYHGFRYVQVTGLTEKPTLDSLTGRWVTTDPGSAGRFTCSNERINKIQELIVRTQLNNMHGIPTDCPQREKMGWMNDGCVCMETAFYNLDTPLFYRKWFDDMMDAQDANGHVPDFVPTCGWGRTGPKGEPGEMADPWWGGTIVMAPWKLYLHYGDTRVLEEGYPGMKAYVDYLGTTTEDHLIPWGLGDWLVGSAKAGAPPQTHISTAAYAYQARIVSQTAALLGKEDDARRYATLAARIRDAFNTKNLNTDTGWYVSNSQTGQALPLALDLPPESLRPQVLARLVESITSRQGHVGTGIVGLLPLFQALMDNGRDDLAYTLLTQEDFPGWLHMINSGATSIWEAWNGDASRNHPTLGCIGVWFYQGLGGIRRDPATPAFKRIVIKPAVVGDLTWVKCSHQSPYGKIVCNWRREAGKLRLEVTIPPNTTATVFVPAAKSGDVTESGQPAANAKGVKFLRAEKDAAVYEVGSGSYIFGAPIVPVRAQAELRSLDDRHKSIRYSGAGWTAFDPGAGWNNGTARSSTAAKYFFE